MNDYFFKLLSSHAVDLLDVGSYNLFSDSTGLEYGASGAERAFPRIREPIVSKSSLTSSNGLLP